MRRTTDRRLADRCLRSSASRLAVSSVFLSLVSCSGSYIARSAWNHARFLATQKPIVHLLASNNTPPELREQATLVLLVREFARDQLGLTVGGSYLSFAEVPANSGTHVVMAAEPLALRMHTWWFPVVGTVPYKGFSSRDEADREAARLREAGLDTLVRRASAFSTLGWFDDPLPAPLLGAKPHDLAATVLHELLHNSLYVAGHAAFSESLATFVGGRGAIAFFESTGRAEHASAARQQWQADLAYSAFLEEFATRLSAAYAEGIHIAERDELFDAAAHELVRLGQSRPGWDSASRNNAMLLQELLYHRHLALFERYFTAAGEDLRKAIDTIRQDLADNETAILARFQQIGTISEQVAQ